MGCSLKSEPLNVSLGRGYELKIPITRKCGPSNSMQSIEQSITHPIWKKDIQIRAHPTANAHKISYPGKSFHKKRTLLRAQSKWQARAGHSAPNVGHRFRSIPPVRSIVAFVRTSPTYRRCPVFRREPRTRPTGQFRFGPSPTRSRRPCARRRNPAEQL